METAVRWFTTGLVVAHEKTSNPRERSPYSLAIRLGPGRPEIREEQREDRR